MKILIEGYNKSIHKRDNQLLIKEKEEELEKINIKRIEDITIIGKGSVTFDALRIISENNIPLMSIDYFGKINYILEYPQYENIFLRKQQYKFSENHQGLNISREIIKAKLLNQRSTIRTLNKSKNSDDVKFYENKINESIKSLDKLRFGPNVNVSNAKTKIMGIEGNASTYYWMAISEILPEDVKFYQRINRFPDDITNAMLNYGYAILRAVVARGNVLFIDEAYSLCDNDKGDRRDFGCRVLESLLTVLAQKNPDMIVILAGYEKEMNQMLEMNPGMKGRFPYKFNFEDYNADELYQIAYGLLEKSEYVLTPEAELRLRETIEETLLAKDAFFHNARWVEQYIMDGVVSAMSDRLMSSSFHLQSRKLLQTVEVQDIETAYQKMKPKPVAVAAPRKRIGFVA